MPDYQTYRLTTPAFLFLSLLAFMAACGILSSDDDTPELEPGPRNYEWTVDTLNNGPGVFYNIWGSSPNNLWAVSTGGLHAVWHFDGSKWEPYQESSINSAEAVYGFSQENVWIGGGGNIYHFDGNNWNLSFEYEKPGMYSSYITDIWGDSPSNIYAVGTFYMAQEARPQGFILHYNGKVWRETVATDFSIQLQRIRTENGTPFIRGVKNSQTHTDTLFLYQYKQGNLQELLSKTKNEVRVLWMNNIGNRIYFIVDNQLKLLEGGGFHTFYTAPNLDEIVGVDGRHKKDVFIHARNEVLHYNGENLVPLLLELPRNVYRAKLFSEEVFFMVWDVNNGTTLVYHGTLTEQEEGE